MGDMERWQGVAWAMEWNKIIDNPQQISLKYSMMHETRQMMGKMAAALLLLLPVCAVSAQELEYNMELGGMMGGCFYMGDANYTTPFKDMAMVGGVLARYNINPRMAVKGDLAMGRVKGSTKGMANKFPNSEHSTFARNVYELGAQYEYNFFAYGTGAGYKDSRRLAPYILAGIGLTYAPKPANHVVAMNIPLGLGVKYKLADRLNVGAEWSMRFTTSDRLDVANTDGLQLDDPYGINSKVLKNRDSYSWMMLYISYDMFPKYRKCNN